MSTKTFKTTKNYNRTWDLDMVFKKKGPYTNTALFSTKRDDALEEARKYVKKFIDTHGKSPKYYRVVSSTYKEIQLTKVTYGKWSKV